MTAGYLQYDVQRDLQENLNRTEAALKKINCDLAVLPELCTCGYLFESPEELIKIAEPIPDGKATKALVSLSQKYQCGLIGGVPELDGGKVYNTAVIAEKGRLIGKYRKIHLSDWEKNFFEHGCEAPVFEVCGRKVGVQICFDLWFPEVARAQLQKGADFFCVPANFGSKPSYHIARVRAMENLCPLLLCNRVGREQCSKMDADFLGMSCLIAPDGTRLLPGIPGEADAATCEIPPACTGNIICRDFSAEINRKIH